VRRSFQTPIPLGLGTPSSTKPKCLDSAGGWYPTSPKTPVRDIRAPIPDPPSPLSLRQVGIPFRPFELRGTRPAEEKIQLRLREEERNKPGHDVFFVYLLFLPNSTWHLTPQRGWQNSKTIQDQMLAPAQLSRFLRPTEGGGI